MQGVVFLCSSFLESGLDLANCVDILTLAETFSLHKLRPQVLVLVLVLMLYKVSAPALESFCSCSRKSLVLL